MKRAITISLIAISFIAGIAAIVAGCSESPIDKGSAQVIPPSSAVARKPEGVVRVIHRIKTQGTSGLGEQEIDLDVMRDGGSDQGSVAVVDGRPSAMTVRFLAQLPKEAQVTCKQSSLRWLRVSITNMEIGRDGRGTRNLSGHPDSGNGVGATFQFAENQSECHVDTGPVDNRLPSIGTFVLDSVRSKNGTWIIDGRLSVTFTSSCPPSFQKMRITDMKVTLTY